MRWLACTLLLGTVFLLGASPSVDPLSRLEDPRRAPYRIEGKGFVTDASHPKHPGDFQKVEVRVRLLIDPEVGEWTLEVESGEGEQKDVDRYFGRRGRLFQVDDKNVEIPAEFLGDISPAAVAALHPTLVASALRERRADTRAQADSPDHLLAWNGVLWRVTVDLAAGRVKRLQRLVHHEVYGDGSEEVRYEGDEAKLVVTVSLRGRETAHLEFAAPVATEAVTVPAGDAHRDQGFALHAKDVVLREVAPRIFTLDLDAPALDTRVTVAEFADFLLVFEGAHSSSVCDVIAPLLREKLGKPIRYFAFSHLHGQYLAGVRSYVHEGATVLVPPTTLPLVEQVVKAPFALSPDALAREPRALRSAVVKDTQRLEDDRNAVTLYNVESQHTDEYLILYFPRQKVLLSGDLLFYRPGKPLTGRSKLLCETIRKLALDVETVLVSWPLGTGYGTKNTVTREELAVACGAE